MQISLCFCVSLLVSLVLSFEQSEDLSQYKVLKYRLSTDELRLVLNELDVWEHKDLGNGYFDANILVDSKTAHPSLLNKKFELVVDNVEQMFDLQMKEINYLRSQYNRSNGDNFFTTYHKQAEIHQFVADLVQKYPDLLTLSTIGQTHQGQNIKAVKLQGSSTPKAKSMYFQALVHAREWLAPTNLLYFMNQLLEDFAAGKPEAVRILENLDMHFVYLVNLDGYDYTWSDTRMWRKNRRNNGGGVYGVDLNRNWGPSDTWCTAGSSTNPRGDTYCGPSVFSEPEIQACRDYINANQPNIKSGIDFHTSGPLILWPWQYSRNRVPDYAAFVHLGKIQQDAIRDVHGQNYRSIQGVDLYAHSGGMIDYNYVENQMWTFTYEGRGPGFNPPPSAIIPAGQEVYQGMLVLADAIIKEDRN